MYGGLFGDLPSAKKQKSTPSANDDAKTNDTKESDADKQSNGDGARTKSLSEPSIEGNWLVPPRQASAKANNNNNKNKNKSQFLQTVGKSGTTMAFIPAAAMKSKRKKPTHDNKITNNKMEKDNYMAGKNTSASSSIQQPSSFAAVTTTTTTTRIAASKTDKSKAAAVVDIHGSGNGTIDSNQGTLAANPIPDSMFHQTTAIHIEDTAQEEKITDLYDPYVPNDLLEYWETLAAKKHREKLERDTREALEQQKAMRQQLEEDRKALLHKKKASESDAAFSSRAAPMGRGRGVSNLPAWLVEKQQTGGSGGVGTATNEPRGRGRGVSNLPAWLVEKQRKEASSGQ